jgi:hypothetical protein
VQLTACRDDGAMVADGLVRAGGSGTAGCAMASTVSAVQKQQSNSSAHVKTLRSSRES